MVLERFVPGYSGFEARPHGIDLAAAEFGNQAPAQPESDHTEGVRPEP